MADWRLPSEVVLRQLLRIDLNEPDAIAEFISSYGIMSWPPPALPGRPDLSKRTTEVVRYLATLLGHPVPPLGPELPRNPHVAEYALYLAHIRATVLHWLAIEDGRPPISAWRETGLEPGQPMADWYEDDLAWSNFTGTINAGLSGLHPFVSSWTTVPDGERLTYGEPHADLFTGLSVQVFNLIVEGHPVHVCANETCGNRFVRQLGRAQAGQSRTSGVRFCSQSCAKAQTQREYRRRQAQR